MLVHGFVFSPQVLLKRPKLHDLISGLKSGLSKNLLFTKHCMISQFISLTFSVQKKILVKSLNIYNFFLTQNEIF